MSRYIDADEFLENESEAYMRAQVNLAKEHADETIDATRYVNEAVHKKIQMLISEAPTADVVEVVRCKDCIKRHNGCPMQVWCGPNDDDYCSRGEVGGV